MIVRSKDVFAQVSMIPTNNGIAGKLLGSEPIELLALDETKPFVSVRLVDGTKISWKGAAAFQVVLPEGAKTEVHYDVLELEGVDDLEGLAAALGRRSGHWSRHVRALSESALS